MKIIAHPANGAAPIVIHDQTREIASSGIRFGHGRQVDVRSPFRGAYVENMNRGNTSLKQVNATWTTVRLHEDIASAYLFCMEHGVELPAVCDVEMQISGDDGAEYVRWIHDCGIVAMQADEVTGVTTAWSYTITYGELLTERPTDA